MDELDDLSFPIVIDQGATFLLPITYVDSDKVPLDLTGYTAQMQIRQTPEATGTPIVDLSTTGGQIVIDGTNGLITITISATTTAALTAPNNAWYDLFITSPGGVKEKLLWGTVTIYPSVTK